MALHGSDLRRRCHPARIRKVWGENLVDSATPPGSVQNDVVGLQHTLLAVEPIESACYPARFVPQPRPELDFLVHSHAQHCFSVFAHDPRFHPLGCQPHA